MFIKGSKCLRDSPLLTFTKPFAKNLWVILDCAFKFDKQINSLVRASFLQLRLLAKVKSFLSLQDLEESIHTFVTAHLDY